MSKQISGIIILNKEENISTNKIIQKVKHKLNIKKIGHAGTLDPLATGVVICLLNNATKLSDYLLTENKEYVVTMKLFSSTDTYDREGQITEIREPFIIDNILLNKVINKYNNYSYNQIPPIYSAIKVNGKKLYQYALENKTIEIKSRNIKIYNTKLINYNKIDHEITLNVLCSKGTYIRSLIVDIAKELNTIAHIKELNRTASGNFNINDSISINDVSFKNIISMYDTLQIANYPILELNNTIDVYQGKKIEINTKHDSIFITDNSENIIANYKREKGNLFKCHRGGFNNEIL